MKTLPILLLLLACAMSSNAGIFITEVAPWSSGNSPLAADWFELTNTGPGAVNLTGWKIDDNSNSFASSVNLRGVSSIAAGESIVFFEGNASGTTDAALAASFNSVWGTSFVFGVSIGAYGGSGVGLSTAGDAVNIYNSGGVLQANVSFAASPGSSPFASFDNSALLNNTTISALSVIGANGAFSRLDSLGNTEIGSPGTIANAPSNVPEPSTAVALILGVAALTLTRRIVRRPGA